MRTRDAVIEYQKTLDDAGTLTKDLDLVDPISALYLEFDATNGTTSNKGNWISDVITKVEIVDGSDVLYSVNLSELEALYFYKTKQTPVLFPCEWASGGQRHGCYLLFGRYLWDRDFCINFAKFKNPQIKITSNLAAITAVSATTAFATGTLKGTIVAKVMEESGVAPSKYLMAKEIDSFTSAASGDKRIDLPVDYVYRMLMIRAYQQNYDINETLSDVKITADTDRYIMLNRKVRQLDAEALAQFGMVAFKHDVFRSNAEHTRLLINKEPIIAPYLTEADVQNFINLNAIWSNDMYAYNYDKAGSADATDRKHTMLEMGHALHATLPIPMGLMDQPDTWFNPATYKKLEAVLTQATASSTVQIVAEQVRPL